MSARCETLIEASGSQAYVIAKIEKAEALADLDAILSEAAGVMVARGDLGVEIGVAEVPLLQKRIIARALERGKPVITATQMLESMMHSPEPTRAEASDVANAILDGTSAMMLSRETAVGEYPVEAVAYMDRIARAIEPSLGYRHEIPEAEEEPTIGQAMSNAACDIAEALREGAARADLLRPHGVGGRAAAAAAADHRAHPPGLLAPAHGARVGRDAGAVRRPRTSTPSGRVRSTRPGGAGSSRPGDRVVITAGTAVNIPGSTNVIKVDIA